MTVWTKGMAAAGLSLTALINGASAQNAAPNAGAAQVDLPGPVDSLQDVQDTGKMAFKAADTNNDGQISQKEAIDAGNLLVGGFFFRADANGDGTLSQDEAKSAREALLKQQPILRFAIQRAKASAPAAANGSNNPAQMLGALLDANNDKQLQATEVRKAVETGVQGLYQVADTNRDGQMSPTEVNAAIIGAARAAAQAAFQAADGDNNGSLSLAEFDKAIVEPAHVGFGILDADGDGQITPQEAQTAQRIIASQLKALQVPEPANSASNLINSGAKPADVAPVPSLGGARPATPAAPR